MGGGVRNRLLTGEYDVGERDSVGYSGEAKAFT